jgi:hypothetical protein
MTVQRNSGIFPTTIRREGLKENWQTADLSPVRIPGTKWTLMLKRPAWPRRKAACVAAPDAANRLPEPPLWVRLPGFPIEPTKPAEAKTAPKLRTPKARIPKAKTPKVQIPTLQLPKTQIAGWRIRGRLVEWFSAWWCRTMHTRMMWPIHGKYVCRACMREYPIVWDGLTAPATAVGAIQVDAQTRARALAVAEARALATAQTEAEAQGRALGQAKALIQARAQIEAHGRAAARGYRPDTPVARRFPVYSGATAEAKAREETKEAVSA